MKNVNGKVCVLRRDIDALSDEEWENLKMDDALEMMDWNQFTDACDHGNVVGTKVGDKLVSIEYKRGN